MRFALFFIAEYANMFAVSAIAVTLFLGVGRVPCRIRHPRRDARFRYQNPCTRLLDDVAPLDIATSARRSTHESLLEVLHPDRLLQYFRHRNMGTDFKEDSVWSIGISCAIIYIGLISAYMVAGRVMAQKPAPQPSSV